MTIRLAAASLAGLLALGLLGCLRAFGPDLRRGVHTELPPTSPNATCMGCHESEADALARMKAQKSSSAGAHATPSAKPGPPLVADWMIDEAQPCTHCHRIRGND